MVRCLNFVFRSRGIVSIRVAKTKALISFGGYREADLCLCFRICIKPVFSLRGTYLCSIRCIAVIMTSLIETFCYEALVVGASWSRLDEAVLAGTHDRWFSRAKNGYHRFCCISQRLEGVWMSYVCCCDTWFEWRLTAWITFFSITGTSPYKGYPRIGTYHIVKMGVINVVAVWIDNFQYFSKSRVMFIY